MARSRSSVIVPSERRTFHVGTHPNRCSEEVFSILRRSPDEFARELLEAAVCKWYEMGWISQSKAAHSLGMSRHAFLDLLCRYGVSPIQATPGGIEREMERD